MTRGLSRLALVLGLVMVAGLAWWQAQPSDTGPVPEAAPDGVGWPTAPKTRDLAEHDMSTVPGGSRVPRGEGAIVGTVLRDGVHVAARIAIRVDHVGGGFATWWRYERAFDPPPTADAAAATVQAGDDGRFAVPGVGAGTYTLFAQTSDGVTGSAVALVHAEGARVEVRIAVTGGREALRGRVAYADGRPFAGTVIVGPWDDRRDGATLAPQGKALAVDTEGRFVATGLSAGPASVTALAEGRLVVRGPAVSLPHAGEYVLTVDAGLREFVGRVIRDEDEGPVAGADVLAEGYRPAQASAFARSTTDTEGRFRLWLPESGWPGLLVLAEGFAPYHEQDVPTTATEPFVIRLMRGATASGRVTREGDGAPVPGLTVTAVGLSPRGVSSVLADPATTDAEGRYTLTGLAPGETMIVAKGRGYMTRGLEKARRQGYNPLVLRLASDESVTADLLVVTGARIEGVVLDAAGAPVAGALVLTSFGTDSDGRAGFGAPEPVATDEAGRFVLEGAVPGIAYTLTAEAAGFSSAESAPVTPVLEKTTTIEIRFDASRYVDVTVLDDATGTPVAGARLVPASQTWSEWRSGSSPAFTTSADGRTRIGPLPSGSQRFRVEAWGYASTVMAVADSDAADFVRLARGRDVVGKVTWSDGSPAAAIAVRTPGRGRDNVAITDAEGSFVLRGVSSGPVVVSAQALRTGETQTARATVDADARDLVLRLGPPTDQGGRVWRVAHVIDPAGRPVPRADATWRDGGAFSGTDVVGGRAEWQLGSAGGTEVWVDVQRARGADGTPLPLGPATVRVPSGAKEVEVRLPPEVVVTGTVRTSDGAPVRGVAVAPRLVVAGDEDNDRRLSDAPVVRTDGDGSFRLAGLGPLDYDLMFGVPPEFVPVRPLRVRGGDRNVDVRLRSGVSVAVTVVDPAGRPVEGVGVRAHVKVDGPRPGWSRGLRSDRVVTTDAKGVAHLLGLDVGAVYTLDVDAKTGDDLAGVRVDPWTARNETVRMPRAWTITGVVRDQRGRPVPRAQVLRKEGAGISRTGIDDADGQGRFRLEGLSPGLVALRAALPNTSGVYWQDTPDEVRVEAGTRDVVLTLDVGLELFARIENPDEYGRDWSSATLFVRRDGKTLRFSATGVVLEAFRFQGLREGDDCTFWLPPADPSSDRSVFAAGLRPGMNTRVRVAAGRSISGRIRAPAGAIELTVVASHLGFEVSRRVNPDGTFEFRGLPEGTSWTVRGHGRVGYTRYSAQATATAGQTVDLELKAPETSAPK